MMKVFSGFPEGKVPGVTLPESLFNLLVPMIDDLDELKVTLLVLCRLSRMQSNAAPWMTIKELRADHAIRSALMVNGDDSWEDALECALSRAVSRGTLLTHHYELADKTIEIRYFANSPRGRATVKALRRGENPDRFVVGERPNIYTLYEQNIGPLTALISEELSEAESTFPEDWIQDAFLEAVKQNKRNWKYIYAILTRWQEEGKYEVDRRDRETDPRRYTEGKYGHLIKH
jgi:DnaD/phage-associated family protein